MSAAAERLDRTLAALADPHRRHTVELLRSGPLRAGELAQTIGVPAPAMSRHLRTLRQSGLVEERRPDPALPDFDARVRVYQLRPEPMVDLLRWLEETERLWSAQLAAFKAHVEAGPLSGSPAASAPGRADAAKARKGETQA